MKSLCCKSNMYVQSDLFHKGETIYTCIKCKKITDPLPEIITDHFTDVGKVVGEHISAIIVS